MNNKFKIIISTIVALLLTTTIALSSGIFKDVSPDKWYYEDVMNVNDLGLMTGYPDGTFRPDEYVTRGQFAKVINLLVTKQEEELAQSSPVAQFDKHAVDLVSKVMPSIAQVRSSTGNNGSGFIIKKTDSETNNIITNYHVIEGASSIEVILNNGKSYQAEVLMTDIMNDIALLSIDEIDELRYLEFTREINQGSQVYVFGHPYGYKNSVTYGIISHTERKGMIQVDAAINAGNSGGAVTDIYGKVVAISTQKLSGEKVDNIAFGVRSDVILDFLDGNTVIYLNSK